MSTEFSSCRYYHWTDPSTQRGVCLDHRAHFLNEAATDEICRTCTHWTPFSPANTQEILFSVFDNHHSSLSPQRNCLMILQPRQIERCLNSISVLPIDKVYFRAYTERQLVVPLNRFIRETDYDNYLLVADDVIVNRRAFDTVVNLLEQHERATGYCHISQDSSFVNVTRGPLRLANGRYAELHDYDFFHIDEIRQFASPHFLSWFGGWALTGMRRALWLEYPFRVNDQTHQQSDFETSYLMQRPFVCHRDAFIDHLKPTVLGFVQEGFLVGRVPSETIYERYSA